MNMKRCFGIAAFVIMLSPFSVWGEIVTEEWARRYDSGSNDSVSAILVDASGNVYVTGYQYYWARWYDGNYITVKYDANGNELWVRRYDNCGRAGVDEHPVDIAVDALNNVYITGNSTSGNSDYVTIKYSQTPSTPAEIISVINEMVTSGAITNSGVANALISSLNNAQSVITTNPTAAKNMLEATINKIEAQSGKQISVDAAGNLIEYLNSIIAGL